VSLIKEYREIKTLVSPVYHQLSQELKTDLRKATAINSVTKAVPTQNIRDIYRSKCGFPPCIVHQVDTMSSSVDDENMRHYPSYRELMEQLSLGDSQQTQVNAHNHSASYNLIPGDIVAVNPGTDNGIPSGDKWWLIQINRSVSAEKNSPGCRVSGFWLELLPVENQPENGCSLRLQKGVANIYYGSLIKENGKPVVIPVEQLNTGWQEGSVVYNISETFVNRLDAVSNKFRSSLNSSTPEKSSSESSSESETEVSVVHDIEPEILLNRRSRIIRNSDGQHITSYAELIGHRRNNRTTQRRVELLNNDADEIVTANKNS
jgi:hypothetical protein